MATDHVICSVDGCSDLLEDCQSEKDDEEDVEAMRQSQVHQDDFSQRSESQESLDSCDSVHDRSLDENMTEDQSQTDTERNPENIRESALPLSSLVHAFPVEPDYNQQDNCMSPTNNVDANLPHIVTPISVFPVETTCWCIAEVSDGRPFIKSTKFLVMVTLFVMLLAIIALISAVVLLTTQDKNSKTNHTLQERSTPPVTFPPSVSPSQVILTNATCGNGNIGNGICPNNLCCSTWGYCGSTISHCNPFPEPTSPPSSYIPPIQLYNDSRLIAYLGNWQSCPDLNQYENYTHIVIAFAVTYTWAPARNLCSTTCYIDTPAVCENSFNKQLIKRLQDSGRKVMISFGGAGMGGKWKDDPNNCWDYCFGRESSVVKRLTDIVTSLSLDGVDINYLYFYEDGQNGSNFTKGKEAQMFIKNVTTGLRDSLPKGSLISHSIQDIDLIPESQYDSLLSNLSSQLDFLMVHYYNGFSRPIIDGIEAATSERISALSHYTRIVNNLFFGDSTKVVFGFCISDCNDSNAKGTEAAAVMKNLSNHHSCNGGAFFWNAEQDKDGTWSSEVSTILHESSGCSSD